jgi:serine/threonine protein kinase
VQTYPLRSDCPAHAHQDVIHGDLGSRNVLVFEPTPGNFVAKISDFGYSSIADDQCLVYLPRTRPWYAPEWRKTAFFHAEAVKVDIFAYGLLSLWILFLHEDNFPPMEELEVMKLDNRLPKLARQLVANAIGLSSDERTNLTSFFHLTLSYDPNVRSDEFFALVHLLSCNTE